MWGIILVTGIGLKEIDMKGTTPLERLQEIQGKKIAVQVGSQDWALKLYHLSERLLPRTYDYVSRIYTGWHKLGDKSAYVFRIPLCDGIGRGDVDYWTKQGYEIIQVESIFE